MTKNTLTTSFWLLLFATMTGSNEALALAKKVIVTGAGGQTGQSLFRKLLALPDEFEPLGLVRSEASKAALVESGISESNIAVVDVTNRDAVASVVGDDTVAFCICTSAKPIPGELDPDTGRPIFSFPNGGPDLVDWEGQKNQIDSCPSGVHVILCSTMGGTDPNHPLNNLGRTIVDEKEIGGNIVKWKRKSEMYLMSKEKSDGLIYTIVHPGGLINEKGGQRELTIGVDDDLSYGDTESRTVPREDVAQIMLESIRHPNVYGGRSFDLRAKPVGEGTVTTNFETLLDSCLTGDKKNCDYSLGVTM
jgi:hypothetical protein